MIRPARLTDAPVISNLIVLAMGNLAGKFANSTDEAKILSLFERFVSQTGNQYSYENILVWDEQAGVCGMIIAYDGAELDKLRKPFLNTSGRNLALRANPRTKPKAASFILIV